MNGRTVELFERLADWAGVSFPPRRKRESRGAEQTLTEHLLLEIKRARLPNVWVRQHPPDPLNPKAILREDLTALDWEWWIGSPRRKWLRFAVQAKKLDLKSQRYRKLKHLVGTEAQHELLARYAAANDAIPLYCFYNHVPDFEAIRN